MTDDHAATVELLDLALDHLLDARVRLGGLDELEPPMLALDFAMSRSVEHRRARARLDERVRALRDLVPRHLDQDVLAVEEAATAVSVTACDTGYRLGAGLARGRRDDA